MKTLIFTAHPAEEGFSHKIANQYAGTKNTQNIDTEVIDLYDPQWKIDFLTFPESPENSEKTSEKNSVIKMLQEKISGADELVFVFPLWWGEAPAIMKNMIDNVFASGFAFEFEKGKSMPKQLLTEKTAKVFITCDAPKIYYWLKGSPFQTTWKDFILGFCGIKVTSFELFAGMRGRDESSRKQILEKVTTIAFK